LNVDCADQIGVFAKTAFLTLEIGLNLALTRAQRWTQQGQVRLEF
jgi:hypothetical protein